MIVLEPAGKKYCPMSEVQSLHETDPKELDSVGVYYTKVIFVAD